MQKYQREARPGLLKRPDTRHLFLNCDGEPLSDDALSWRVRHYFEQAGIAERGACRLFRHTLATAMLDNGANIRHVRDSGARLDRQHASARTAHPGSAYML